MFSITQLLGGLLLLVVLRCVYLHYFHPLSRYPQPFFAGVTNLWRTVAFFKGDYHHTLQRLHLEYGSVVRTGPMSLSLSTLEAYDTIYGFTHRGFTKGSFYDFGRDPVSRCGSIFTAPTDAIHRDLRRKVVGTALTRDKVATYEPIVKKHVETLLSCLAEAAKLGGGRVDLGEPVHQYTVYTAFEVVHGKPLSISSKLPNGKHDPLLTDFKMITKFSFGSAVLPWLNYLLNSRIGTAMTRKPKYDADGHMVGITNMLAQSQKASFQISSENNELQPSVLRNLLRVPPEDSRRMEADQISRECANLMFAGQGSTAASLTAILWQLGTKEGKPWQDQIRHEPTGESFDAVLKETLRLRTPFPSGFPREVTTGVESVIPGITGALPVGTEVSVNLYVLGHSRDLWGDDVDLWRPERWLETKRDDEEDKEGTTKTRDLEDRFVVFGRGPRACVGRELAVMMLKDAVMAVLERWEVVAVGDLKGKDFFEMQYIKAEVELVER